MYICLSMISTRNQLPCVIYKDGRLMTFSCRTAAVKPVCRQHTLLLMCFGRSPMCDGQTTSSIWRRIRGTSRTGSSMTRCTNRVICHIVFARVLKDPKPFSHLASTSSEILSKSTSSFPHASAGNYSHPSGADCLPYGKWHCYQRSGCRGRRCQWSRRDTNDGPAAAGKRGSHGGRHSGGRRDWSRRR
uniref:Uncharacterized protein n=1 Tax=Zea mays TaxID=4577 RepID=C0PLB9_MAIZE|nr:unknown [Zea mays]